jgi:hypothetical protein
MKLLLSLLMLLVQTGTIAAVPADPLGGSRSTAVGNEAHPRFSTSFLSLSPGHAISSSLFIFGDGNSFEIQIPGVDCFEPSGSYTQSGLTFKADFSAAVRKGGKRYRYTFSAKGIWLFDSYIGGIMELDEWINETGQQQKVTFVFWGTSEAAGSEEKKNLFPF